MAFDTVVAGTAITATWGNTVRDQYVAPFASTGARSSAITSPVNGQVSAITAADATHGIYQYNGTAWRTPWNIPWGLVVQVTKTTDQTGITTLADLSSMTTTQTAVANRYWRITAQLRGAQITAGSTPEVYITDGSNNVQDRRAFTLGTNEIGLWNFSAIVTTSAGSLTYKLRAVTGGGTFTANGNSEYPMRLIIEDIGPAGAPS